MELSFLLPFGPSVSANGISDLSVTFSFMPLYTLPRLAPSSSLQIKFLYIF